MRLKVPYFFDNNEKDVAFHQPKLLLTRGFIKKIFLVFLGPILFCYIILSSSNFYNINLSEPSFTNESNLRGNKEKIKKAVSIIKSSKRSVIIVGAGVKYNSKYKEIIDLAELCNMPIVTAAGHGDAIPFNHKLNAGQMGPRGNPVASKLVKEADVILAIGTRLGFN